MKNYLSLMRITHYLKNILVFLPIFFSGNIVNVDYLVKALYGFVCFCFISSIVYIINDINDIESDKKHPVKKDRPLASGKISIKKAIILIVFLAIIVFLINVFLLNKNLSWILLILYLIINVLYSIWLKHKPIIDVFVLSLGFLIRVLYGGLLLNIDVSNWMFLTILSGALFMAIGKRRNELKKNKYESRKVLKFYSIDFLDKTMYMFLTMSLTFFSLWTTENHSKYLIYSIPLLILICLKYVFDIDKDDSFGDPVDVILSDKTLIILSFLLLLFMIGIIYIVPMVI